MTHDEFFKSLKAGTPTGLYLFEGEEEHIKRSALSQLESALNLGAFSDMNVTAMKDPDADKLIAASETLPFMSDKRLVVVRESGMLSGKAKDYDEASSAERLKDYLPALPDTTVLVFYVRGAADKRKKLYQTIKKCGKIVTFDRLDQRQLQSYIARTLKKAGLAVTSDACDRLIYSVGDDLTTVLSETEKLIAYCDGRDSVTADDIRAVCSARTEYRVFELAQTVLEAAGAAEPPVPAGLRRQDLYEQGPEPGGHRRHAGDPALRGQAADDPGPDVLRGGALPDGAALHADRV